MKYIRTKDGRIIKVKKRRIVFPVFPAGETRTIFNDNILENDVIKQSDNPEELCDEFVWVTPEGERRIKPKTGDALWYLCCDYKQGHQIYGAIWTDKGLSYAMKMNERGNWELL